MIDDVPLIGIYAPFPRSGKGEVLNTFIENGYIEITFARVVKSTCKFFLMELGVPEDIAHWHLYEDGKEEVIDILGITGGQLLSTFATDFVRDTIDIDIWLARGIEDAKEYIFVHGKPKGFVSGDLRFLNEHGECDITLRLTTKRVTSHNRSEASEGNLEKVKHKFYLSNDGTLEELKEKIETIIKEIEK